MLFRSDIAFYINGKDVRSYGSQGQQKTVVLALKLAEVRLIREEIGESPVLLLDDIMSELDKHRQAYVMSEISDMQVIITATERDKFEQFTSSARYFEISGGGIIKSE